MKKELYNCYFKVKQYLIRLFKLINKNELYLHSASISYYILFSLSPFIVFAVSIIPYTPLTKSSFILTINYFLPRTLASFAESLISEIYALSGIFLPISLIVILWSASLGIKAVREALIQIYELTEHKNIVKRYVASMLYTLLFIVLLMIVIVFGIFGEPIYQLIDSYLPAIEGIIGKALQFHNLLTILATTFITTMCYLFLPPKNNKLSEQKIGIIFTVIIQFIFSKLFSIYLTYINNYLMYGSLSIIVITLLYIYWNIFILLLGAQINQDIKNQKAIKTDETF